MTCTICGRYAEPDRETGYDADGLCPQCSAMDDLAAGIAGKVDPIESDLHDLGSVLASLADLVKDCHDPAKLFDVRNELRMFSVNVMKLEDFVADLLLKANEDAK